MGPGASADEGIAINRVAVRARIDDPQTYRAPARTELHRYASLSQYRHRCHRKSDFGAPNRVASASPGLYAGIGAERLWPVSGRAVRSWVEEHISGGMVERLVVAGNAPGRQAQWPTNAGRRAIRRYRDQRNDIASNCGAAHRDADLTVRIIGRNAVVNLGRGTVEAAPGRKLNIAGGVFEVPDTHPKPAPARASFRIDGGMPAAAALLASEGLRDEFGITLDPAATAAIARRLRSS
jgi:hypothetical protein